MTELYTSNFASVKRLSEAGITPVAIAAKSPPWLTGLTRIPELAPRYAMLKLPRPEFDEAYLAYLATLDPEAILQQLPERAAVLCWEARGVYCHRRAVAEWLESKTGLVIPEYSLTREETGAYDLMPEKAEAAPKHPRRKPDDFDDRQCVLF